MDAKKQNEAQDWMGDCKIVREPADHSQQQRLSGKKGNIADIGMDTKGKNKSRQHQGEIETVMDGKMKGGMSKGKKGENHEKYDRAGKYNTPRVDEGKDHQEEKSQPYRSKERWVRSQETKGGKLGRQEETRRKDMDPRGKMMMARQDHGKVDTKWRKGDYWRQQQQNSASATWDEEDESPKARTEKSRIKGGQDQQKMGQDKTEREHSWQRPYDNEERQEEHSVSHYERATKGTSRLGDWKGQEPLRKGEGGNEKGMDRKKHARHNVRMEPYGKYSRKGRYEENLDVEPNYQ